jgi:hypothetical protein
MVLSAVTAIGTGRHQPLLATSNHKIIRLFLPNRPRELARELLSLEERVRIGQGSGELGCAADKP